MAQVLSKPKSKSKRTTARLKDDLFNFLRTYERKQDEKTGFVRSRYEKQAEFILYRINIWRPNPPTFTLYEADLEKANECELRNELDCLDDKTLDGIMRECIYDLMDELNTSTFAPIVKRRDIRWEIKEGQN